MTYSCTDFTDDMLNALSIDVPEHAEDNPSAQADLALAEIERLQAARAVLANIRGDNPEFETGAMVDHADVTARIAKRWPELSAALAGVPVLPASDVFVAVYDTRHGDEVRTFHKLEDAEAWRREITTENWTARMDSDMPTDPEEAADAYFEFAGEARGDFFRVEECKIEGPAAPSPGIDWLAIAQDLAGALDGCTHQIGQMSGMFPDDDGAIQQALDDAEEIRDRYQKAVTASPAAPSASLSPADQAKAWTALAETHRDAMRANLATEEGSLDEAKARYADAVAEALAQYGGLTPASV